MLHMTGIILRHKTDRHTDARACVCKHIQICASRKDSVLAKSVKDWKYRPTVGFFLQTRRVAKLLVVLLHTCWSNSHTCFWPRQWVSGSHCTKADAGVSYLPSTLHYQSCCPNHSTPVSTSSVKKQTHPEWSGGPNQGGGEKEIKGGEDRICLLAN